MTVDATSRLREALGDSYRIERVLGAGGMATVFLAHDLRHDRKVAIKVLRPGVASSLGTARFLEEIRIAAKLTHPHILPLHDSGARGGFVYYVMPYSDGESLADRLDREGELPVAEAVEVLVDVVDALAYAHQQGVVHRDIKPGNVLTQGRHAMIVDFGVAKALREASTHHDGELTGAGVAIGTPAYMAPEQAAADPSVDRRVDVYAVGVLGYELLTGRTPFSGGSPQSVLTRQITETPKHITEHRASVPPGLAALIMRCLEKRAADRWQSADEILPILRAIAATGDYTSAAAPVRAARRRRSGPVVAAALIGVAGLLGIVGGSALGSSDPGTARRAVVDVFDNQTGDPLLDPVGQMFQDWLTDGLLQSSLLEVVPTITARQAAAFVDAGVETGEVRDPVAALARETGASIVVTGTIYRDGDGVSIRTSVTGDPGTEDAHQIASLEPVSGPASDVGALLEETRERLLGALGAKLNRRLQAQIGASERAPRFEAYQVLNEGLERYVARDYREASELFLRAFELDSSYAVPLVYASLSLRNHGQWARSDSVVAILEGRREELSEYQRHWIDYSRAVLEGDLDRARVTIRRAAALAPGSKAAYNWALTALRMGRPTEAREALATLDPERGPMRGVSRYWMRQIEASHHLGEHEREFEQVEELAERHPDDRSLFFYTVRVYAALGWTESLKAAFAAETVARYPPEVVAVRYRNAAVDLFVHGHPDEAREMAELGISWIDTRTTAEERMSSYRVGIDLRARQQLAYQKGRLLEVLGRRAEALEIYEALYAQLPEAWFLRAHIGVVHASLGRVSAAMQVDRWLQSLDEPYDEGDVTAWRAGIAARLGDLSKATALLAQARREGKFWSALHPLFHLYDAMDQYQPFIELMAPQG